MAFEMFVEGPAEQDDGVKSQMKKVEKGLLNNNIGTRNMS
jgi:hypothetical protein